jgi:hypothetical protein
MEEGRKELFGVLFRCEMGCTDGGGLCLKLIKPSLRVK